MTFGNRKSGQVSLCPLSMIYQSTHFLDSYFNLNGDSYLKWGNFVKYFPIYSIKTAFHLSCPQIPTYLWYNVWLYCRAIYICEKPIFVDFVNQQNHEFICQQIVTTLVIYLCVLFIRFINPSKRIAIEKVILVENHKISWMQK